MTCSPFAAASIAAAIALVPSVSFAAGVPARAKGIDVSVHNGTINWSSVAASGVQFAYVRSSYGSYSTTGDYDANFAANRSGAVAAGLLVGAYHYIYPDDATDAVPEADNFWTRGQLAMKAGNLRPMIDVEDPGLPTGITLSAWVIKFNNEIASLSGVQPIIYCNTNYAKNYLDSSVSGYPLWLADYGSSSGAITESAAQTATPPGTAPYGNFATTANPDPWVLWQYSSVGSVSGVGGSVDLDVAHGDLDYLKQFKIPAIWQPDADGAWGTATNWNTPANALPTATDRVVINRSAANPLVTVSVNARVAQSLDLADRLAVTSGSLTIAEYANLNGNTTVSGGALSAGSIANAATLAISGGTATSTGALTGAGTTTVTGGTLNAASITQASLVVAGTGRVKLTGTATNGKVNALNVATTAVFDAGVARIVDDYTGATPINAFRALALAGAVTSSNATGELGVGFIEATRLYPLSIAPNTLWNGVTIDGTSMLVQLTLFGDTDLNGMVNVGDLAALAAGFGKAGTWQAGDFNYDGVVDSLDLAMLAANYGKLYALGGSVSGGDPLALRTDLASFPNLVPEPTALAALAIVGAALRRRRRV